MSWLPVDNYDESIITFVMSENLRALSAERNLENRGVIDR